MLSRSEAMSEVMWHLVSHDAHGYSQPARAGDGTEEEIRLSDGERVVVHGGDYDCSEAVRVSVDGALSGSHYGPIAYMWTGTERDALLSVGFEEISPWKARNGDVLLRKGHTEMVIARDGALMQAGFRLSESGGIRGRKGDQTGKEATWSGFRPEAWHTAFRYAGHERGDEQGIDIRGIDMNDWAIIAIGGTGCLYAGGRLHPLASADEQAFVEWVYEQARAQREAGAMPHVALKNDGGSNPYQTGPWGDRLREILAR